MKKKLFTLSIIGLVVFLSVWIIRMNEEKKSTEALMNNLINQAISYRFNGAPEDFPQTMSDILSDHKLLLVGEIHYAKEHQVLMSTLIKRLYDSGFRYYVQEIGSAHSILIDHYIKGDVNELSDEYITLDRIMIEALREFNYNLREQGKGGEQISYLGFDMNHFSDTYKVTIKALQEIYQNTLIDDFVNALSLERTIQESDQSLMKAFIMNLQNFKFDKDNTLNRDQVDYLIQLTENELDSLLIRQSFNDHNRENYIEHEVLRAIERSKVDEKLIVNCGAWHAQLEPIWVIGNDKSFNWLGMRLAEYYEERSETFYSLSVTSYKGELKSNIASSERKSFDLTTPKNSDLVSRLYESYGNQYVFIDYKSFEESDAKIKVSYPNNSVNMPIDKHFNGLFVYPQVTVPKDLVYFEKLYGGN